MKIVGIIAEYNPFHNGHQYHIDQALQKTGADAAVILMSGDFVQRGAPAIAPKHLRAKAALLGGASLILELPVLFSCGSAELFARGAVSIFNSLGCISYLCFGSECGDIKKLNRLARILSEEPEVYRQLLQDELRKGRPFPQARQTALSVYAKDPSLAEILSSPNNTLGIEYLKALRYFKSPIQPFAIPREGSGYNDTDLCETFSSATAIRNRILNPSLPEDAFSSVAGQLPPASSDLLRKNYQSSLPVTQDDFSLLLKYRLLCESASSLTDYLDVSKGLANRIINQRNDFATWSSFCDLLKTRELTYTRISRALLHILLGIKKDTFRHEPPFCFAEDSGNISGKTKKERSSTSALYARVLGFQKKDTQILKEIKEYATIPLITKLADARNLTSATQVLLNLANQDTSNIPKTIQDNGRTLTLQTINWQTDNTATLDGYALGDRFTAVATYTGSATSSYVKGYTVTADYTGTVGKINLDRVRYVAIFEGTPLQPVEEVPAAAAFSWAVLLVPIGMVALVGAVAGAALFIRHRREHEPVEENEV